MLSRWRHCRLIRMPACVPVSAALPRSASSRLSRPLSLHRPRSVEHRCERSRRHSAFVSPLAGADVSATLPSDTVLSARLWTDGLWPQPLAGRGSAGTVRRSDLIFGSWMALYARRSAVLCQTLRVPEHAGVDCMLHLAKLRRRATRKGTFVVAGRVEVAVDPERNHWQARVGERKRPATRRSR